MVELLGFIQQHRTATLLHQAALSSCSHARPIATQRNARTHARTHSRMALQKGDLFGYRPAGTARLTHGAPAELTA